MTPHDRDAEQCERRPDRSPADQATGGIILANGSRVRSQHAGFLAACLRAVVDAIGPREAA